MPVAFESCFADSMRPELGNIACSKRQEGWVHDDRVLRRLNVI